MKRALTYTMAVIALIIISISFVLMSGQPIDFAKDVFVFLRKEAAQKRLVVGCAGDAISLDPIDTTEMNSAKVTVNIFETLVKYDQDGNTIAPCLAESWKSSEDGLTWVFYIRQGVKFHDGSTFNAHDVVFNFHRWMYLDNPYHTGQFSYWNYIFGGFPGFVKHVIALSDYSIEIKLTKPYAPFLSALTMPAFGISSPDAIREYEKEYFRRPVGTGPFVFSSWDPNKNIILERNNSYWATPAKVKELEFRVIPSSMDRLEQLKLGKIHIANNLEPDEYIEAERTSDLRLYLRPYFNVGYIALNNEKPPFNSREVRAAISHAINKDDLVKKVFVDLAKPAKTFIPPLFWGYNENIEPYEYNPLRAIELLKTAGYTKGFSSVLWVMDTPRDYFPKPMQVAEYIKESLEQVNINIEIKSFQWDEYLNKIDNGEHELALIGWTGDNIDPDNFLNTLLSSDNAKPGLAGNYAFYKNPEVDMLLTQARQTSNMVFRKNLYRKLLEIVNYEMPSVPLVHTMPVVATTKSVKGFVPFVTGVESLENVFIEEVQIE